MRIEFCISSIEGAIAAQKWRADRVELCRCLSEDGLTPDSELIEKSKENFSGDIHVMIRPVGGAFVASKQVLYKMKDEMSRNRRGLKIRFQAIKQELLKREICFHPNS